MASDITLTPIGIFKSSKKHPYQAARQAVFDISNTEGLIELNPQQNFEQCLKGLEGFSHIWVIFHFHNVTDWQAMVQPPRGPKQGVFATRSPHRPCPIGMSVLRLNRLDGRRLYVGHHDLLDGTPVLDIKPYHIQADCFPHATQGWIEETRVAEFELEFSKLSEDQIAYLERMGLEELRNFLYQQLTAEPLNAHKKRVFQWQTKAILAYRTWRILFRIEQKAEQKTVQIEVLYSGYSEEELSQEDDKYGDKELHRRFREVFASREDLPRFSAISEKPR